VAGGSKMREVETVQEIRSFYNKLRNRMGPRHAQWLETLNSIMGDQYKIVRGNQLVDLSKMRSEEVAGFRVTHNFLFQAFRSMLAVTLQNEPTPIVALFRAGQDGRKLARACERLLQYCYFECEFRPSAKAALSWAFSCGTGFLGAHWDMMAADPQWIPDVGPDGEVVYKNKKELIYDEDGLVTSEYGTPLTSDVMVPQGGYKWLGDLRFFAPSPFDVFPEPVRNWGDARRLIIRQFMDKERLVTMYGDVAKDLVSDVSSRDFVHFDNFDDPKSEYDNQMVLCINYYEKPTEAHPEGRYICVANEKIIHEDSLLAGRFPIHPIYDMEHPVGMWGESSIRQALDVQRNLNSAETDLWMDRRMHAQPRLLVEQNSLVDGATRIPNTPGAVVQVKPTTRMAPTFLSPPGLPRYVEQAPERYQRTIEDITGAHGITKGSQKGIMSGRQASVILAADRQKWAPTMKSLARAVEQTSELALLLWKENAEKERSIEIYGPTGSPTDVAMFHRDYVPDQVKVRIEVSTMMPYNEELRTQRIMEFWQLGAIKDVSQFWKLMRHGEMGQLMGNDEPSTSRAHHENATLDTGRNVPVEVHEDHPRHLEMHLQAMREPDWYQRPEAVRAAYRLHVAQHQGLMQGMNPENPVLTGASQMPGLVPDVGAQPQSGGRPPMAERGGGLNMAPSANSAAQASSPGVNRGLESRFGG
jgi:hypothetical protein